MSIQESNWKYADDIVAESGAIQKARDQSLELGIRPENAASIAVARKLRMREEGLRPNFLHIDGAWRDHRLFALTREQVGGSLLDRLVDRRPQQSQE